MPSFRLSDLPEAVVRFLKEHGVGPGDIVRILKSPRLSDERLRSELRFLRARGFSKHAALRRIASECGYNFDSLRRRERKLRRTVRG